MIPTEAIASIRASIAAGLSPSLSDIEVLIEGCRSMEELIAAKDEALESFARTITDLHERYGKYMPKVYIDAQDGSDETGDGTQDKPYRTYRALTTQSPRNENG